jgi:putative spermidine/putrescine transport system permease protein
MTITAPPPPPPPPAPPAPVAKAAAPRSSRRFARGLLRTLWITALALFILAPLIGVLGSSVTTATFWEFPPRSFTLDWYARFFSDPQLVRSLFVSIGTASFAAIVGTLIGILAALVLAGTRAGRSGTARSIVLIPLLIPHLTLGVAIFTLYVSVGLPINLITLGAAQLIIVIPMIVGLLVIALESMTPNVQRAAADLGATPFQTFTRVTLPLIRPAVIAAAIIAFIRGFDDASIALFVNSPTTITLPVRMLIEMEHASGPLIAASGSVLLLIAVVLALVLERTIGLSRAFGLTDKQS